MKTNLRYTLSRIFLSPFVVAIPFALVTILLLQVNPNELTVNLVSRNIANKAPLNTIQSYTDLDGDGRAEEISHFSTTINNCAVKISTGNNRLKGQWNFDGTLTTGNSDLLIFDHDNNGAKEVFTIYNRSDSVFIGGLNPENDSANLFEDIFLDRIMFNRDTIHFSSSMQAHDMDNDGYKDVVIALSAGYSEQPRRLITWSPLKDSILRSESVGVIFGQFSIVDIDRDGTVEIIPSLGSNENIDQSSPVKLNDWNKWFVVYSHELKPEFEPIDLGKGNGSTRPCLFWSNGQPTILVMNSNKKTKQRFNFYLYDWNTGVIKPWVPDVDLESDLRLMEFQTAAGKRLLIIDHHGYIHVLNLDNLLIEQVINTECKISSVQVLNINNDSLPELLFENDLGQYCIYSNDFSDHSLIEKSDGNHLPIFSYRDVSPGIRHLVIQDGHTISEYSYQPNPERKYYIYLIYLAVYLGYVLTIGLIMFGQRRYLKRRYNREKVLAELKLKSIRNQMDPHFTFNAVNAIASAIFKEDKQSAYTYFSKFSKLVRSTMLYSDRMTRILDEELDFTLKYLEIEKFRFREKFEYEIKVDEDVNLNMEVPRMIIQAFAESAINNGLMHKTRNGLLLIKLYNEKDQLAIEFVDNGVGIEKSKKFNKEKAFMSARIMEEFIAVFNEFNKSNIKYQMRDVVVDSQVAGTRVYVGIPFKFSYSFLSKNG